ncbi:MAG: hypothetical protein R3D44_06160 [Hyphomicrobiaceae bacterium]
MVEHHSDEPPQRRRGLSASSIRRGTVARLAIRSIRLARHIAWQFVEILLAAVILFEEWGWRPLSAAIAALSKFAPVARLETWVRTLSPWPALLVFLLPSGLFLPLKLLSLWLIGAGHLFLAALLFAFAKVAGTALYARIFQLTQPRLMELRWFARAYNSFMPWKDALIEKARATKAWHAAHALKVRVRTAARAAWQRAKPIALAGLARVREALGR